MNQSDRCLLAAPGPVLSSLYRAQCCSPKGPWTAGLS